MIALRAEDREHSEDSQHIRKVWEEETDILQTVHALIKCEGKRYAVNRCHLPSIGVQLIGFLFYYWLFLLKLIYFGFNFDHSVFVFYFVTLLHKRLQDQTDVLQ